MLGPAATASAPGAGAPAPFRVRRQQASAMTHAELAAALLGTQIARGHGDLDLWRRQLRTVTVATFILAVATTRISAVLVWVSAFRVSALAFLLFDGEHPRNPRGHAMARPAVMPFKNVDGEPCFACGETENTRWYCAYDPGQIRRWLCRTP